MVTAMLVWWPGRCGCGEWGCEYMGDTRGSGFVSTADNVLGMSGVRDVGGVCEMCMCLARGRVGGESMRGLGLGFTNAVGTGGKWYMCLGCGGVGEWVVYLGLGGWAGVMSVCVVSMDCLWRWQVQLSVYCARRIPAHLRCT